MEKSTANNHVDSRVGSIDIHDGCFPFFFIRFRFCLGRKTKRCSNTKFIACASSLSLALVSRMLDWSACNAEYLGEWVCCIGADTNGMPLLVWIPLAAARVRWRWWTWLFVDFIILSGRIGAAYAMIFAKSPFRLMPQHQRSSVRLQLNSCSAAFFPPVTSTHPNSCL